MSEGSEAVVSVFLSVATHAVLEMTWGQKIETSSPFTSEVPVGVMVSAGPRLCEPIPLTSFPVSERPTALVPLAERHLQSVWSHGLWKSGPAELVRTAGFPGKPSAPVTNGAERAGRSAV